MPRIFGIDISATGDTLFGPITLLDNQASPQTIHTFNASSDRYIQLQYSISRNGFFRTGRLLITNNGSAASLSDDNVEAISALGIVLSATVSGPDLLLQYTSANTGFNASFEYFQKKWS